MRFYRMLLRLCPRSIRDEYGDAMEDTFARRLDDARREQWRSRLWRREIGSLLAVAIAERWRQRRRQFTVRADSPRMGRMDSIGQELRHAARRLVRTPAFTCTAIATLALAIGANAAIFAVVQRVVINPLPYPDSDRLIEIDHGSVGLHIVAGLGTTQGLYFHYLERARSLTGAALYRTVDRTLTGDGE